METAKKKELQALAVKIRMAALEAIHSLGSGHLGGALSICDVLAALYPAFAERGWQPEVSLVEDVVIEADGEAVRRIVENLLANCLRHGSAAPTVELHATGSEAVGSEGAGFVLTISNAAADLGALDEGRLGERFYRGDASRRAGGSGLGLATACSLADAMGLCLLPSIEGDRFIVILSF